VSTYAIKVYGIPEAAAALNELPRRLQIRHMRIALNAAAGLIRDSARSIVRRESGLLAKSLKVGPGPFGAVIPDASKDPRHHGKPAFAVIGPARRYVGPVVGGKSLSIRKATKRVLSGGTVQTRRPSRYAHLIEKGHGGPHPASAYPFLSRAVAQSKAAAMAKATRKLQDGIVQSAAEIYGSFSRPTFALTAG
jgi:hypothetical protein